MKNLNLTIYTTNSNYTMQCQICLHVRVQPHSFKRPLREVLAEEITNTLRLKTIRGVGRTGGTPVLESDILDYSDATVAVNDGAAFVTTVVRTSYWRPELGAVYERNKLKVLAIDEGQLRILLPRPVALSKEEEGAIRNAARIPDYCRASLILEKDPASSIAGSEAALALLAAKSSDEKADQQAIATAFAASLQTFEVTVPAHSLPKGSVYDKAGQFWRVCTQSGPRGQYDDFVVVKSGSFLPFSLQIDNVEFVQVAGSARTGASTDILSSAKGNMLRGSGSGSSSQVGNTPQVSSAAAAMAPFRAGMSLPSGSPRGSKHVDDSTTRVDFANSETQSYIKSDEKSGLKRIRCGGDFTLQRIGAESGAAMTSGPMSSVLPPPKIQPTLNHSSSLLTSDGAHLSWPPSSSLPNRPWLFPPAIGALSFNPGLGFGLSRLQGRVSQKKNDLFSKGGKSDPKKAKVLVPSSPQPSASIVMYVTASLKL